MYIQRPSASFESTLDVMCPYFDHANGTIIRCVADDREAYHAGHSKFGELENLNRTFLGAEWLVPGEWNYQQFITQMGRGNIPFTDEQYDAGGWLYATWIKAHGFGLNQILTHMQVSGDHVRGKGKGKRDPGVAFNRGRFTMAVTRWLGQLA